MVVLGGGFFIGWACGDGNGAFDDGPHFAAAVVVLPGEALAGVDHEDFWAETYPLVDGDALHAWEEVVSESLGVFFINDQEAAPRTSKVLVYNMQAKGLNPLGRFFHLGLIHGVKIAVAWKTLVWVLAQRVLEIGGGLGIKGESRLMSFNEGKGFGPGENKHDLCAVRVKT